MLKPTAELAAGEPFVQRVHHLSLLTRPHNRVLYSHHLQHKMVKQSVCSGKSVNYSKLKAR